MRYEFNYSINKVTTPCATFVFERICCVSPPASGMDRVADTVVLDAGGSDTEVASDLSSICDTPKFSSSEPESCPLCDTPEFPTTRPSGVDAPIPSGQTHRVGDLWSPSTSTPNYERCPPLRPCCTRTTPILLQLDIFNMPADSGYTLLVLPSFHCLLRPAKARHFLRCGVQTLDGSLSTRCENKSWHHQHQTSQSVENGRSGNSSMSAPGMFWNLRADPYNGVLTSDHRLVTKKLPFTIRPVKYVSTPSNQDL